MNFAEALGWAVIAFCACFGLYVLIRSAYRQLETEKRQVLRGHLEEQKDCVRAADLGFLERIAK